jgi:hypothetical protein
MQLLVEQILHKCFWVWFLCPAACQCTNVFTSPSFPDVIQPITATVRAPNDPYEMKDIANNPMADYSLHHTVAQS